MIDLLHLAWRHLLHHRGRSLVLVLCLTVVLALPWATRSLVSIWQDNLLARAEATPLVIGAAGSRFDLVLHALHFTTAAPGTLPQAEREALERTGHARVIPLHVRFRARGYPVVGTTLDYFDFRQLELAAGRGLIRLGDCVVGAGVAAELGLQPGDWLRTDHGGVFDLVGGHPLELRVNGILQPTGSADDNAVFVDVQTAWVIEGIGHGHEELSDQPGAAGEGAGVVLERGPGHVVAGPELATHQRISEENIASFHFHGDPAEYPLTALIALPTDERGRTLVLGRYAATDARQQAHEPAAVAAELLGLVIRLKRFLDVQQGLLVLVAGLLAGLVFWLSVRLRAAETRTMIDIGCARGALVCLQAIELALLGALALAGAWLVNRLVMALAGHLPVLAQG